MTSRAPMRVIACGSPVTGAPRPNTAEFAQRSTSAVSAASAATTRPTSARPKSLRLTTSRMRSATAG
jgi:hypothetical protein